MHPDTPKLAQLIADWQSISAQIKSLNSRAESFTYLFNVTRNEQSKPLLQDLAIEKINESLLLQKRLAEIEILIHNHKFRNDA